MGIVFLRTFRINYKTIVSLGVVPVSTSLGLCGAIYGFSLVFPIHNPTAFVGVTFYAVVVYTALVFVCDHFTGKSVRESMVWMRTNVLKKNGNG